MMKRLAFLLASLVLAFFPQSLLAQQKERVWKVGFLSSRARPENRDLDYHVGFPKGMKELGYIEGKNLVIEWRYADGKYERFPELLSELLRIPVDVLVTDGTPTTQAAMKLTKTVPIVFGSAGDPVGNGLVQSLARPGGNVTGLSLLALDFAGKMLEMLRAFIPGLTRVAVVYNPGNPYSASALESVRKNAVVAGIQVVPLKIAKDGDMEAAFEAMKKERAGAFFYISDSFIYERRADMARLAAAYRMPGMSPGSSLPTLGGLLGYGPSHQENYRRAAGYVDRILKGASPAEMPVEQPTKLELVINKKTANELGLTIPPELLLLADRVIE